MPNELKAVLFDMDGTLVDTEDYFVEAARELLAREGLPLTDEVAHGLVGSSPATAIDLLQGAGSRLSGPEIDALCIELVSAQLEREIPWLPGAAELLHALKADGIATALVTMSQRPLAEKVVATIGAAAFDVIVTADDVANGKPAPDAYLQAMAALGVSAAEVLVVEDSLTGMTAGISAGARVVSVSAPGTAIPDGDVVVWGNGLAGSSSAALREVHAAPSAAESPAPIAEPSA